MKIGILSDGKSSDKNVIAPSIMCSREDNTRVPEIIEFAKAFGRPIFDVKIRDDDTVDSIWVLRGSPCGSTVAASAELPGTRLIPEQLQHYGLRICHFCRAPRLGKTCDREVSGLLHIRELVNAVSAVSPVAGATVKPFSDEMEKIPGKRSTGCEECSFF